MTRGRSDGAQKKCVFASVGILALFIIFLYAYFGSNDKGESALEYGSKSLRKLGWSSHLAGDDEGVVSKTDDVKLGLDDGEGIFPKSFPVCDDRHSELIPCLDRNLIYQMRLKLDLSVMEPYERHCPLPERRFNCLILLLLATRSRLSCHIVKVEFGKRIYRILILHMKSLTRTGWLSKAIKLIFREAACIFITDDSFRHCGPSISQTLNRWWMILCFYVSSLATTFFPICPPLKLERVQ